jgi:hypothetical protein
MMIELVQVDGLASPRRPRGTPARAGVDLAQCPGFPSDA